MSASASVYEAAELLLALLLAIAGGAKATDLSSFVKTVRGLGVPNAAARPVAILTVGCELLIAATVAALQRVAFAPIAMASLYILFAGVTTYGVWARPGLNCSCFGRLVATRFDSRAVFRTFALAAAATAVAAVGAVVNPRVPGLSTGSVVLVEALFLLIAAASAQASQAIEAVQMQLRRGIQ
jgi:hypothetical protein